jgi:putative PIG3 family NAD(P)H quinone oxidoreductase
MRAVDVVDGRCVPVELPSPVPGPGELRLRVVAAGVNRADLSQKAGRYPPPPGASPILGLEASGVVDAVGPGVEAWKVGDAACALLAGGGYAEQVVVDARHALPLPAGVDHVGAAAIVEVFATAWLNLFDEGGLRGRAGGAAVLHAGGSGVGTAGVQLLRAFGHASFVTAGSAEKIARCVALGASGGWNRHDGPWLPAVQAWRPDGVDVVLDPVGGGYLDDDLAALAPDGRVVILGLMGGRSTPIDLGRLLVKRLRVQGSTLRSRDAGFKARLVGALRTEVWPRFADGSLRPIVDRTFPLAEAEAAHAHLASDATFGSVVLTV